MFTLIVTRFLALSTRLEREGGLKLQIKTNQNEYAAHVWVEMCGCIYNEIEYAWVWCDKCQMLLFL